jgi:hypothetical protein
MAIIKMKAVKNLIDFSRYVLDVKRHKREKIIEINDYKKNIDNQLELIEEYQQQKRDKRGKRPRPISLIIAMKENQTLEQVTGEYKNILKGFYEFVNRENDLELNKEDIKKLISGTPSVLHYGKNRSGHFHLLLNRVISSKKENKLITIDLSKKIYHRELMRLSGHTISEQIQNKRDKSLYNHKLEKLEEQFKQYQNINDKLDKFILIALNDLKKGHSAKALKKLKKIKQTIN